MKYFKFILAFSCSFVISCEIENNDELHQESSQIETPQSTINRNDVSSEVPYDAHFFERRMQWLAYLSAKIIMHNPLARDEVRALVVDSRVNISELIGEGASTEYFKAAFTEEVHYYFWSPTSTTGETSVGPEEQTPPGGVSPCCIQPQDYPTLSASDFMDLMSNDICIELYFPNPLTNQNSVDIDDIYSTAHPLSLLSKNYGYKRTADLELDEEGDLVYVQPRTINPSFVGTNKWVVVARPVRINFYCHYTDYNYISSFEDFLNNN